MPVLLAIIGLLAAAGVWAWRICAAGSAARDLADMASDVMGAARALGFRRRANVHPVESVDDPNLAITAIAMAFLDLDGLPAREDQQALAGSIVRHTGIEWGQTEEMMIVGRWLINECNGPAPAITRLSKRLNKLDNTAFQTLLPILNDIGKRAGNLSEQQRDALAELSRRMKLG